MQISVFSFQDQMRGDVNMRHQVKKKAAVDTQTKRTFAYHRRAAPKVPGTTCKHFDTALANIAQLAGKKNNHRKEAIRHINIARRANNRLRKLALYWRRAAENVQLK